MSTPLIIALVYVVSFAVFVSCGFWLVRRYWSDKREFPTARVLAVVVAAVVILDVVGTLLFFLFAAWVV